VCIIIGVLVAMLLPAVQKAREAASRAKCENNLKEIGLAFVHYEGVTGAFPSGLPNSGNTIFWFILDYVEQGNNKTIAANNTGNGTKNPPVYLSSGEPYAVPAPVPVYLCPSRRGTEAGPRVDYCAAFPPEFIGGTTSAGNPRAGLWSVLQTKDLNGAKQGPVNMMAVTNGDGAAYTALLAHKAVDPSLREVQPILCCGGSSSTLPTDFDSYFTDNCYGNTFRGLHSSDWAFNRDKVGVPGTTFSTPHDGVMPCVFVDGSVQMIATGVSNDLLNRLFAYNDGLTIGGNEY
jgi:hypothetical protein